MDIKEKLEYILEQQAKGVDLNDIAYALYLKPTAVRAFMTRQGYCCKKGIFYPKDTVEQTQLTLGLEVNSSLTENIEDNEPIKQDEITTTTAELAPQTNLINNNLGVEEQEPEAEKVKFIFATEKGPRGTLKLTPGFIDSFDEMRDWFLNVKDLPQLKHKVTRKNKEVFIDKDLAECDSFEKTKIGIESECLEKLERLCKNSNVSRDVLISQAIREFLKTYKHLL